VSQQPTVLTSVKVDINPSGVTLTFEGIDTDLANLLQAAGTFTAQVPVQHSFDTSDLVIKSDKVISFVNPTPPTP
jgi:hypothetical protein